MDGQTMQRSVTLKDERLSDRHIEFISRFIYERSGILLGESKRYLIESRLKSVAKLAGLDGIAAVCKELAFNSPQLQTLVLDALTTNETSWFRDAKPYDALARVVLPAIHRKKKSKVLQIWSAACSTGQEPYSIAMKILESDLFKDWRVRIVATDISSRAMEQAKEGLYSQLEANRGLPVKFLIKYFRQIGDYWQVKPELKQFVSFRSHKLQNDAGALGAFDLIFCRNVLIYFDVDTKRQILSKLQRVLTADGLLALGGSETTLNLTSSFEPVRLGETVLYARTDCKHNWNETSGAR